MINILFVTISLTIISFEKKGTVISSVCFQTSLVSCAEHIFLANEAPQTVFAGNQSHSIGKGIIERNLFLIGSSSFLFRFFLMGLCGSWPQSCQSEVTSLSCFFQCLLSTCCIPDVLSLLHSRCAEQLATSQSSWSMRKTDADKPQDEGFQRDVWERRARRGDTGYR